MKIAILGTRGIPANYGGFETFAEELGARLAERGHWVTVYGRSHYIPPGLRRHRGVDVVVLPTIRHKYLDTLAHTLVSTMHAVLGSYDAILMCNAANAVFCAPLRLACPRVVLNVDGIERKRQKWNALGRLWYLVSERLATWFPHAIVTDALVIRDYYRDRYAAPSTFIPYGCVVGRQAGTETLEAFGLEPDGYLLYVSRLEPENNAHRVIAGYEASGVEMPLVIVGDAPYAKDYIASLKAMAGPRVRFTGAVYGKGYRELQSHAWAYIHATEVGGTHPALVEAMGFGNCVVVNDAPENREVVGNAGLFFRAAETETLAGVLRRVVGDEPLVRHHRTAASQHAAERFSWDAVTSLYETLFESLGRVQA